MDSALTGLAILIVLVQIILGLAVLLLSIYGLYLAASASLLLFIVVLFVEPAPLVFALVYLLFNVNLAQKIVDAFSK